MTDRFANLAVLGGVWLLVSISAPPANAEEDDLYHWAAQFEERIEPILKANCYQCHGDKKAQAELNLAVFGADKFGGDKKVVTDALDLWERVRERVEAGEMPPEGAPEMSEEQKKILLAWTGNTPRPDSCNQIASDATMRWYRGYVMSRRITRYEYNCCIRDLTGLNLRPANVFSFPTDGAGGEGFNTAGGALFTSAILMEKYLAAADYVIETVLPDSAAGFPPYIGAARARLLVARPSDELSPREAARQVVAEFARRAYRRPVEDEEVERLLTLYDAKRAEGASHLESLRHMLKAVLISPHFLFLVEADPGEEGVYRLNPYELATRVSFFIWSSMPDEELTQLAASGEIYKPEVLRAQVKRMLKDPRSRALGENFGSQWLSFGPLGVTLFPHLDQPSSASTEKTREELAWSMRGEIVSFLHGLFRDDRPLTELLDADYTYLNERLANFYDVESVAGSEFQRVSLSEDSRRGGLLTMSGILLVTSHPDRTSPVLRGRWVLEALLGSRVPPPPPGTPELEESHESDEQLTLRQRLEEHRKNPSCASCHSRMDPIGFGLENFDRLGRWRVTDAGQPIDTAGKMPSGATFSGPDELKQLLLTRKKHELLRNLTKKMLGYALGRGLNKLDQCVVRETLEALKKNDNRASVLIEQIVLSYPFQHRYYKK
jgi:mono/diheme cytochrome c family protein